ncbi:Zinc finger protein 836 [Araneus ventricosus]|uniref:Zinc finger protein 836 n=1 Tax=Araneus ventricosus TaxID=182803 RepID=A0A4Y2BE83_ARAVE|nr:Zinc finger protein 836 [Araneus ventricosus]
MHSLKNISPKKHEFKTVKKSPIKAQDGRDNLVGMPVKSDKDQIREVKNLSPSKSFDKSDNNNTKSDVSPKQPMKKLGKRREEKDPCDKDKKKAKKSLLDSTQSDISVIDRTFSEDKSIKLKFLKEEKGLSSFICKYCCQKFRSEDQLRSHVPTHGSNPPFKCYVCGVEAGAFSSLMAHCVKHSRKKSKNEKSLKVEVDMNHEELQMSSPKSNIQCHLCKATFSSTEKLASHPCVAGEQKSEYECNYCGHRSLSIDGYRLHVMSHSVEPHLCMHCNFKGPTKKLLLKHQEICKKRPKNKKESMAFRCKKCSKEYAHRKELNQHIKLCKGANCKVTLKSCSKCECVFNNKHDYDNHTCKKSDENVKSLKSSLKKKPVVRKKVERTLMCSLCGEMFDNQDNYKKHKQICNEEATNTLNENISALCSKCGNIFHSHMLKEHYKVCLQSPDKPGRDSDVTKAGSDTDSHSTRRSTRLVRRKSSASEENSKFLEERPKMKKFKKKLLKSVPGRKGRQSKLGKDNFRCIYCDLTFCSKSTLLRHKRMHSGNPYFSCKYCGKFFFRKDVYTRHEVNVHSKSSKNVFCCYYCRLYFADPSALKEHVLANHKENAFLPVKPEFSKGLIEPSRIKKEPVNKSEAVSKNLESKSCIIDNDVCKTANSSLMVKKCGICLQSFGTISEIEKHMKDYHKMQNPDNIETSLKNAVVNNFEEKHLDLDKNIENKGGSSDLDVPNNLASSVSHDKESSSDLSPNNEHVQENEDLNEVNIDCVSVTETQKIKCKLCSEEFLDKAHYEVHEKADHILIEWFKCTICERSGPKQDMIDHMFSHMLKVGSFVINRNANNIDLVLPYTLGQDRETKIPESDSISDVGSFELMDEVLGSELPPLKDSKSITFNSSLEEINLHSSEILVEEKEKSLNGSDVQVAEENEVTTYSAEENECNSSVQPSVIKEKCKSFCAEPEYNRNSNVDINESSCNNSHHSIGDADELASICTNDMNEINCENVKEKSENPSTCTQDNILNSEENTNSKNSPDKNSEDFTNFSQLRYLLENFKKQTYPMISEKLAKSQSAVKSSTNMDCVQLRRLLKNGTFNYNVNSSVSNQAPTLLEMEKSVESMNLESPVKGVQDINSLTFSPEIGESSSGKVPNTYPKLESQQEQKKSINTLLKFDINQFGCEMSEGKLGRISDVIPTNAMQKEIDFSDLLKISDSNSANDDSMFLSNEPLNFPSNSSSQSDNLYAYNSNPKNPEVAKFYNNEKSNEGEIAHLNYFKNSNMGNIGCVMTNPIKPSSDSKNIFPAACTKLDNVKTNSSSMYEDQHHLFSWQGNSSPMSNKTLIRGKSKPLFVSEHIDTVFQNTCNKCGKSFKDKYECVRHYLTCATPTQTDKNNHIYESVKYPETLHSLLSKNEARIQHQLVLHSSKSENKTDGNSNENVLNLSRNSSSSS